MILTLETSTVVSMYYKINFLNIFSVIQTILSTKIILFTYIYINVVLILQDKYSQNPKELIRIIKKCLESESLLAQQNNVRIISYGI